jgi:hypothetical protein
MIFGPFLLRQCLSLPLFPLTRQANFFINFGIASSLPPWREPVNNLALTDLFLLLPPVQAQMVAEGCTHRVLHIFMLRQWALSLNFLEKRSRKSTNRKEDFQWVKKHYS